MAGNLYQAGRPKETLSTAELIHEATEEISRLVRDEMRLAREELTEKGKRVGLGAGLFGGAGAVAFIGGAALAAAVILLLALALPAWISALIVGVVLLIVAVFLGAVGKKRVSEGTSPMPRETMQSVRADIDTVRERAHR